MDKTAIKKFAVNARLSLIEGIKLKAASLGISEAGVADKLPISTSEVEYYKDELDGITGHDIVKRQRFVDELERRATKNDFKMAFHDLVEEVAYTWFNRIIAIRFMEVNDYLPSRTRVLSSTENRNEPDIMVHALDVESDLGGFSSTERDLINKALDTEQPTDMDAEYRMLFIKQANALNKNLPYLFENTNDYAELLFTPNYHDGVIQHLITDVSEDDFNVAVGGQVEIIGWLYQYYNTEPKDQAFKKKKYLESDIPAVTQLFTPDWIVKYMVDNSLGRYWIDVLQAKGDQRSDKEIANDFGWRYFMPAAKQTEQVSIQSDSAGLSTENIEKVTLIDAAMGSGHILIYAFEVFMQIYEREGYSRRDSAKLIIQNNLYGLDIDTRAFQLAYFSLMMKARATNRRFLTLGIRPNVFDIPESEDLTSTDFQELLTNEDEERTLNDVLDKFRFGNEYGSLIQFKEPVNWATIEPIANATVPAGQLSLNSVMLLENQEKLHEIIAVGKILDRKFTIGAMNPPYMGSGKMDSVLGKYVKKQFPNSKADLFAVFMERLRSLTISSGYYAMITQHAWMFLSSFEKLRQTLKEDTLINMAHLGTRAFEEIGGEVVQSTTFVFKHQTILNYIGTYERLVNFDSQQKKESAYLNAVQNDQVDYLYRTNQANFAKIPGMPIAYWASENLLHDFEIGTRMDSIVTPRQGLATASNNRFLREWFEVTYREIKFDARSIEDAKESGKKWFPYNKGGSYRKWYGNYDYVVNWENDGNEIRHFSGPNGKIRSRPQNTGYYFHEAITWPLITSGRFSMRLRLQGSIHDVSGMSAFTNKNSDLKYVLGIMNSKIGNYLTKLLNPTINLQIGNFDAIPVILSSEEKTLLIINNNIERSKDEWDMFEASWDFQRHPLLTHIADDKRNAVDGKLENAFNLWQEEALDRFDQLKANEEELNRIFIDLYGLNEELTPEVADKDVSVRLADEVRDIKSFLSYFVGVVFGRYSLDTEGLTFAGGEWDESKYHSFVPNEDNILMLNDSDYFGDSRDIMNRLKAFLTATFGAVTVEENLSYIASVIGKKADSDEAAIRRYFVEDFFKDHKKIYQKRPIYWEFNSGRHNGFKALMYLHRYDSDELAMVRTNYLHPLQGKYELRIDQLTQLAGNETVASQKKRYEKALKHLEQQLTEIRKYDPLIQHIANQKIKLDLDDGVVVNYDKLQAGSVILSKLK
ncbi:BREX-1 system adenine-specific DNA-methyltransferase PglX [Levilactobacillus humaensis]|uniref:BREX-1 system adenine-specific DNA-methyltransferase PglX n=1 Tax=Levilactobacillus humaensis TaxID=2950375 RepID=UPI0021C42BA0|nr:BREX-1 system adenine-specific DNA-methyltransferase PglX [Levilactobacillus humaensis]